jgi:hypothetical protein
MIGGIVAVVVFHFTWILCVFRGWQIELPRFGLPIHLLTLACMMALAQAVVWSLYAFPWIRFAMLVIALVGCGFLGIAVPSEGYRLMSAGSLATVFGGLTLLGWIAAVLGVARDRRGEWQGWTGKALAQVLDLLPARRKGFASPAGAQFWFEWHRKAVFASVAFALPLALTAIILPLGPALYLDRPTFALMIWGVPFLGFVMASSVGQALASPNFSAGQRGISLFLATRPSSSGSFVMAKLKVVALVTLLGYALVALLTPLAICCLHLIPSSHLEFPRSNEIWRQTHQVLTGFFHPVIIAAVLALTWHSMVAGLSIGLFGPLRRAMIANLTGMLVVGVTVCAGLWLYQHPESHETTFPIVAVIGGLMIVAKAVSASVSFRSVRGRSLCTPDQLLLLAAIWLALAIVLTAAAVRVYSGQLLSGPVVLFIVGYLFPGAELPNCALHLSQDRHR